MKCPFCHNGDFAVVDTRVETNGFPVRRKRCCTHCRRRVSTVEQLEDVPLKVVKRDQLREPFDRAKLRTGLERACYKRPISAEEIDRFVQQVESEVYEKHSGEVPSAAIGEIVMKRLQELDQVAYVRFASVYRRFTAASDFVQTVRPMLAATRKANGRGGATRKAD